MNEPKYKYLDILTDTPERKAQRDKVDTIYGGKPMFHLVLKELKYNEESNDNKYWVTTSLGEIAGNPIGSHSVYEKDVVKYKATKAEWDKLINRYRSWATAAIFPGTNGKKYYEEIYNDLVKAYPFSGIGTHITGIFNAAEVKKAVSEGYNQIRTSSLMNGEGIVSLVKGNEIFKTYSLEDKDKINAIIMNDTKEITIGWRWSKASVLMGKNYCYAYVGDKIYCTETENITEEDTIKNANLVNVINDEYFISPEYKDAFVDELEVLFPELSKEQIETAMKVEMEQGGGVSAGSDMENYVRLNYQLQAIKDDAEWKRNNLNQYEQKLNEFNNLHTKIYGEEGTKMEDGGEIKPNIVAIIRQQGEGVVKDSIIKSIRDLKKEEYSNEEIEESISDIYGSHFLPFAKKQMKLLFSEGGDLKTNDDEPVKELPIVRTQFEEEEFEYGKGGEMKPNAHLDELYKKAGNNIFGALELYAGELGIYNMYYGEKVDAQLKAKHTKAQKYLVEKYRSEGTNDGKPNRNLEVLLKSVGNPDFGQDPNRQLHGCEPGRMQKVLSFKEASEVCLKFIADNDLGGGNWAGGQIFENQIPIAYVSYNGRVWEGKPTDSTSGTKEIKFERGGDMNADITGDEPVKELPVIRSQFEEEEFEYGKGGILNKTAKVLVISSKAPLHTQMMKIAGKGHNDGDFIDLYSKATHPEHNPGMNVIKDKTNNQVYVIFSNNYYSQVDKKVIDDDLSYVKTLADVTDFEWTDKANEKKFKRGGDVTSEIKNKKLKECIEYLTKEEPYSFEKYEGKWRYTDNNESVLLRCDQADDKLFVLVSYFPETKEDEDSFSFHFFTDTYTSELNTIEGYTTRSGYDANKGGWVEMAGEMNSDVSDLNERFLRNQEEGEEMKTGGGVTAKGYYTDTILHIQGESVIVGDVIGTTNKQEEIYCLYDSKGLDDKGKYVLGEKSGEATAKQIKAYKANPQM